MINLNGQNIYLRALEPEDIEFLFCLENDSKFWQVSGTQQPFAKHILEKYIEQAHLDIYEAKQLRLVIANKTNHLPLGLIDLYDFNPQHKRAGLGILILNEYQNKGYAKEAVNLLKEYAFKAFDLHQIFAEVSADNKSSIVLFEQLKFKQSGIKKDWNFYNSQYTNVVLYQCINSL